MGSNIEISQYISDRCKIIEDTNKNLCASCPIFIQHKE